MSFWWLLALVVAFVPLFVWLSKVSAKAAAENHKIVTAKWEELFAALRETHKLFGQKQVTDETAIDILIDAGTHLAPANWMVSTRRVISSRDFLERYAQGLELVKKAREKAGV